MNTNPMSHVESNAPRRGTRAGATRGRLTFTTSGLTDQGLVREKNEDRFLVADLSEAGERRGVAPPGYLLAVADGVGGARGGEIASTLAIETIAVRSLPAIRSLVAQPVPDRAQIRDELRALVRHADQRVAEAGARRPQWEGMATTLTVAALFGSALFVAHIGDSRCYLLRDRVLRQLTDDQTVPAELVRRGLLSPEDAEHHAYRNVLTDFVGGGPSKLQVESCQADLAAGDMVLLSSDGLTNMVSEREITSILITAESPEAACQRLVARANALGGHDNVTVVVARCAVAA